MLECALAIEAASFFEVRKKDIAESATLAVTPKKNPINTFEVNGNLLFVTCNVYISS